MPVRLYHQKAGLGAAAPVLSHPSLQQRYSPAAKSNIPDDGYPASPHRQGK